MTFLKKEMTNYLSKVENLSLWNKLDKKLMPNRFLNRALFLNWPQKFVDAIAEQKSVYIRENESFRMVHPILEIADKLFHFEEAKSYGERIKHTTATYKNGSIYIEGTENNIDQWAKQQEEKLNWYKYELCNLVYIYRSGKTFQLLMWELLPVCFLVYTIIRFISHIYA